MKAAAEIEPDFPPGTLNRMFLLPVPGDRVPERLAQLFGGLVLFGVSIALIVRAELGVMPWTVLEQGLKRTVGLSIGVWSILIGVLLLVVSGFLGQRPGLGTLVNVVVVGVVIDATLMVLPPLEGLPLRIALLVLGILLNGVATGASFVPLLGLRPRGR